MPKQPHHTSHPSRHHDERQVKSVALVFLALAIGGFALGSGEFGTMGLLVEISQDLRITVARAGNFVSAYALGVTIGAPLLAILCARFPQKPVLMGLLSFFALGNFATYFVQSSLSLEIVRFLTGLPHGAYFGFAVLMASDLAPPKRKGAAVGWVMAGLTLATLVGAPMTSFIGEEVNWRWAYVLVGLVAVIGVIAIFLWAPVRSSPPSHPLNEVKVLTNKNALFVLLTAAIGFGGTFAFFSYLEPVVKYVTKLGADGGPIALAVFGAGAVCGNLIGARMADWSAAKSVVIVLVSVMLALVGFYFTAANVTLAFILTFIIGGGMSLTAIFQTLLIEVSDKSKILAAALLQSALNIANALGAWLGGLALAAKYGWTSPSLVGAGLALTGLIIFFASGLLRSTANKHPKKT